jgi:hypothetical protein
MDTFITIGPSYRIRTEFGSSMSIRVREMSLTMFNMLNCQFTHLWLFNMEKGEFSKSRKERILCSIMVLIVMSPMFVVPLSSPVLSNAVIVMHEDDATALTLKTLQAHVPDIQVIIYGSLSYYLSIFRLMRPTLWLSHGTDEGILAGSKIMSWRDFAYLTKQTPSSDIILACESSRVNEFVNTREAVGLEGYIDARLAGLIGSLIILSQTSCLASEAIHGVLDAAFSLIGSLVVGALALIPLGVIPSWWGVVKAALIGVITGIYFLSGEAQIPAAIATVSNPVLLLSLLSFFVSLLGYVAYLVVGSAFPSLSSWINWMSPALGAACGVVLSLVLGGALPGASYVILYLGGWLASLIGVEASWAAPWSRAAFAASAAIFIVSVLDVLLTAYWTYYV